MFCYTGDSKWKKTSHGFSNKKWGQFQSQSDHGIMGTHGDLVNRRRSPSSWDLVSCWRLWEVNLWFFHSDLWIFMVVYRKLWCILCGSEIFVLTRYVASDLPKYHVPYFRLRMVTYNCPNDYLSCLRLSNYHQGEKQSTMSQYYSTFCNMCLFILCYMNCPPIIAV